MERRYGFGVMLVVIGGFFLSTSGILLRNLEDASGWQVLFYRGITFSITLFLLLLIKYRSNIWTTFQAIGRPGLWAALVLGLGSICYVYAILLTTVANAVFIIGAAPLATAFVAWLVLGEKTSRFGVIAMLVSLTGIGLMFADGLLEGRWHGNLGGTWGSRIVCRVSTDYSEKTRCRHVTRNLSCRNRDGLGGCDFCRKSGYLTT